MANRRTAFDSAFTARSQTTSSTSKRGQQGISQFTAAERKGGLLLAAYLTFVKGHQRYLGGFDLADGGGGGEGGLAAGSKLMRSKEIQHPLWGKFEHDVANVLGVEEKSETDLKGEGLKDR